MLEYPLHVPSDCVAAITAVRRDRALALMRDTLHARTTQGRSVVLE